MIQCVVIYIAAVITISTNDSDIKEKLKSFDYKFYIFYNLDLQDKFMLKTEQDAIDHYISFGYIEGRLINASDEPTSNGCNYSSRSLQNNHDTYLQMMCNRILRISGSSSKAESNKSKIIAIRGSSKDMINNEAILMNKDLKAVTSSSSSPSSSSILQKKINNKLKIFDYQFYLKFNSDLVHAGINTEASARDHYIRYGYEEKRWISHLEKPSMNACKRSKEVISLYFDYDKICKKYNFEEMACQSKNHALEQLVISNHTRTLLYIISHDDKSQHIADAYGHCREWVYVLRLGSSKFFESVAYNYFLRNMNDWIDYDYIVVTTYKTIELAAHNMKRLLIHIHENEYDCIPFLRSYASFLDQARHRHGFTIIKAWDLLLLKMGYSIKEIRNFDDKKPFFRNIFIIKPMFLLQLSRLMRKAMSTINADKELSEYLASDSFYIGTKNVAMKTFGTNYYQLHPFIFERLPAFFLYTMKANVCIGNKYNSYSAEGNLTSYYLLRTHQLLYALLLFSVFLQHNKYDFSPHTYHHINPLL